MTLPRIDLLRDPDGHRRQRDAAAPGMTVGPDQGNQEVHRVLCIAGYGRSGSTLLEKLLQCHPEVHPLGEVAHLLDVWNTPLARCSCGDDPCPWWTGVIDRFAARAYPEGRFETVRTLFRSVEGWRSRLPRAPLSTARGAEGRAYGDAVSAFFSALKDGVDGRPLWIDSSKTAYPSAYHPFALRHLLGYDVRLVHLVRDPRGVIHSLRKGRNQRMELGESGGNAGAALRGMVGWRVANRAAERHRDLLGADRYLRVRYEDLVAAPRVVLEEICAFAGLAPGAFRGEPDAPFHPPPGHQLSGNRMRFQNDVVVTPHAGPAPPFGRMERILARVLGGRQMRMNGYRGLNG